MVGDRIEYTDILAHRCGVVPWSWDCGYARREMSSETTLLPATMSHQTESTSAFYLLWNQSRHVRQVAGKAREDLGGRPARVNHFETLRHGI